MTEFVPTSIPDVFEITPRRFHDPRGMFSEVWKKADFDERGIRIDWIQDNYSLSVEPGTIRGMHFQLPPFAQDKLVRVLRGTIYDVAVDLRATSPTYGKWVGVELSAEKGNQLLIPIGFAHGFMTCTPDVEVHYKVSAPYSAKDEGAIRWDDPDLAIEWPRLNVEPKLSDKDRVAPPFREFQSPF
jgi:dTDP-4-dehydrorhamnose 3,5-epimerase